jgi:type IV fimbrial biogenesis protein FimT
MQTPSSRRAQRGLSLVECTMAMSVAAMLGGLAAPSFDKALQRRHLEGAAAQLATDIHYTRSLAVTRNAPLRISFDTSTAGGCYVIHSGAANACGCDADGAAVCQGDAQAERSVRFAAGSALSLSANVRSVLFDPVRGTSTPTATLRLASRDAGAIHQVMNITGRVRSCSPAPAVSGYRRC